MPGIRTLSREGYLQATRTYASIDRAVRAAEKAAAGLQGVANVIIVPVISASPSLLRYTPVFSCFSNEVDIPRVAFAGFICHR